MVEIAAGAFLMGTEHGEKDELPIHRVAIAKPFALGRFEVTRGEFARFAEETGHTPNAGCRVWNGREWAIEASLSWRRPGFDQTDDHPVVCVSWRDAKAYVNWLSARTGMAYRLPTEAEWEYAARAGTLTERYWGDDPKRACGYANVGDRAILKALPGRIIHNCTDGFTHTAPVGRFRPNPFGLYDALGNVWEWVEDCADNPYAETPADGSAALLGDCDFRAARGASWLVPPAGARAANRGRRQLDTRNTNYGFRVARPLP